MTNWAAALNLIEELITGRNPVQKEATMNDIPTSPETLPEAIPAKRFFPLFLQPLDQRLQETNFDDLAPVCEWLNLPLPEHFPTPGQARTWGKDEWSDWANRNGFANDGESAHSWMWRHPLINTIIISVAKTPSDFRTPMAMATQTRRMARTFATAANAIVRTIIKNGIDIETGKIWIDLDEAAFKQKLINIAKAPSENNFKTIYQMQQDGLDKSGRITKTVQDLAGLLGRIHKDFEIPPAKVICAIQEGTYEEAKSVWDRIKLCDPLDPITLSFYDEAKDFLENLREIERAEKDAKRAEREREDAERKARQEAAKKPKTSRQVLQELIDQESDNRLKDIRGCIGAAISAVDRLRGMEARMAKGIEVPEIEDPAMKAEIEILNEKIRMNNKIMEMMEANQQTADAKISEMQAIIAAVDPERLKKLNEVESHMHALASLVIDSVNTAKSANPFQMAEIFNSLVTEAKNFLPVDAAEKASK